MKTFYWILIALYITSSLKAQQVIKVDCCVNFGTKAIIIINDNTTTTTNSSSTNTTTISNVFNFTLSAPANTSAGVYNSSGILIRTLWSGVHYELGCYSGQWDGLLDDGTPAPYGSYVIKVQSNSETQTWEGGIGNTSDVKTGPYIHGFSHVINCMAFAGTTGYYSIVGSEGASSQHRFNTNNPLRKSYADDDGTTLDADHVCTDGNYVYWTTVYKTQNPRRTGVFARKVSDFSLVNFSSGFNFNYANVNYSLGDTLSLPDINGQPNPAGEVRGLAVSSNYVFVARPGLNRLDVLNKNTMQLLDIISINGVYSLVCTSDNKLWISSRTSSSVTQYTINNDATLTSTGLSIPCGNNVGIAISPANGELAVADAAIEQIKFYNTSGTLTYTLGQLNGYANDVLVANDKFMFINSFLGGNYPYIAYQPDGSFWVGDAGNYRNLHWSASKTYLNQIAFIPSSRRIATDINDPTRVFSNFLEFKRDYSKTLDNGENGSWKLYRNWFYGKDGSTEYDGLFEVATLSNGRTYNIGVGSNGGTEPVLELTPTGLRNTGVILNADAQIRQDGSLEIFNHFQGSGLTTTITECALTGFDGNNNPQWASPTTFVTTEGINYNLPVNDASNTVHTITANPTRRIFWNGNNFAGPHLAAIKRGDAGTYLWKTSFGTNNNNINDKNNYWRGDYPRDGSIDGGNDKHPDISSALVYNDDAFWNDHGEFWKTSGTGTQINIWNHYNATTGLLIGNFGLTGYDAFLYGAGAPGMAGNAFSTSLVKVGNDYYIYHCDESYHSLIHSWKISNVNSLKIQAIPVTVTEPIVKKNDPADLMAGILYRSKNFYSSNGWTIYPTLQDTSGYYPRWFVATSLNSNAKNDIDLTFYSDGGGNPDDHYLSRTLGNNNTNNWALSGYVYLQSRSGQVYFETVDATGKVLTQFKASGGSPSINSTAIVINDENLMNYGVYQHWQHYIVKNVNGMVTFQYANYPIVTLNTPFETGGNFNTPSMFRVRSFGQGSGNGTGAVKGLRFVTGLIL